MNVTTLPPKMLAEYVKRAKNGEATEQLKHDIFLFRRPGDRNEICIIGDNVGHITRMSHAEMMQKCPPLLKTSKP